MERREFITLLGAGVGGWPRAARAQQAAMPVVALINSGTPESGARYAAAFRSALVEAGYIEGRNVAVEYHWLEGRNDRVPALITELVRRRMAVIATPGFSAPAVAARAATSPIPIRVGTGEGPLPLGLGPNLPRPAGHPTRLNVFLQ